MSVSWDDDLTTGIPVLDEQHRRFTQEIQLMMEAVRAGKWAGQLGHMLTVLEQHTREHFETEERLMRDALYPHYEAHRRFHDALLDKVRGLKRQYEATGQRPALMAEVAGTAVSWVVRHMGSADKALAHFLRTGKADAGVLGLGPDRE